MSPAAAMTGSPAAAATDPSRSAPNGTSSAEPPSRGRSRRNTNVRRPSRTRPRLGADLGGAMRPATVFIHGELVGELPIVRSRPEVVEDLGARQPLVHQ